MTIPTWKLRPLLKAIKRSDRRWERIERFAERILSLFGSIFTENV